MTSAIPRPATRPCHMPHRLAASAEIDVDVTRSLVRYTLSGFFDLAAAQAFDERRRQAMKRLRCGRNRHVSLLDISGCRIQSQEVVALFEAMLREPRTVSRALAVVSGGSVARMQLRRILERDEVAWFANTFDAEPWLLARAPLQPVPTASATLANPSRARAASSSASSRIGSPGPS